MITQLLTSLLRIRAAVLCAFLIAISCLFLHSQAAAAPAQSPPSVRGATSAAPEPAQDSGRNAPSFATVIRFVGKFHVLIIHFPIALLVVAGFSDCLFLIFRNPSFAFTSGLCLCLGAPAAVLAAALGWAVASSGNYTEALQHVVELHRWLGTITAGWVMLTLVFRTLSTRSSHFSIAALYRVFLYGGAVLVGITAHFGGSLIYGADYLMR